MEFNSKICTSVEESKRLLEVAKRTVEIAIEEDEEKAIQYINKYGKSLYDK